MKKACVVCGGEFEARGNRKTCGASCAEALAKAVARRCREANRSAIRAQEAKRRADRRALRPEHECRECQRPFIPRARTGSLCSAECRRNAQRKAARESHLRLRDATRERRNLAGREWKRRNRAACNEYRRQWAAANKERVLAVKRARYARNPEKMRALNRAWVAANPEKARASAKKANDAWRARNPNYNRDQYQRNAEAKREYSREWKRNAVVAHKLVCRILADGPRALFADHQQHRQSTSKPRIRVRKRDERAKASERRHAAKRYAALQLVRAILTEAPESI